MGKFSEQIHRIKTSYESPRLLVWGINYAPEETGIAPYNTDLCAYLRERGCSVSMVTAFPYYPHWQKRPGDRWRLFRRERDNGVKVYRCALYVPSVPTAARRMLHEASFVAVSFLVALFLPRPRAIFVVSPPLLLGTAARLLSMVKRAPCFFHVQDMQPDAAIAMGFLRPGRLTSVLYRLERIALNGAAQVSGITEGMLRMFREKGVPPNRLALLPNWRISGESVRNEGLPEGEFRRKYGVPADAFLLAYSGNLGRKQGLSVLIDLAGTLRNSAPAAHIAIAGDGGEKKSLEERVRNENLPNVSLLSLLPRADYEQLLREADVSVVTQQKGSGALFFPSKLLRILPAGKPVLAVADPDSELARAVADGDFGICVPPDRSDELAATVLDIVQCPGRLAGMGERGREWVRKFERAAVLEPLLRRLLAPNNPFHSKQACTSTTPSWDPFPPITEAPIADDTFSHNHK